MSSSLEELQALLDQGDYAAVLGSSTAQDLVRGSEVFGPGAWSTQISQAVGGARRNEFHIIGTAALNAFLQSNVTGPPLTFEPRELLFQDGLDVEATLNALRKSLSVDGEAPYELIPNVELFCLARVIFNAPNLPQDEPWLWSRARINVLHQRLLSEVSPSLQELVYDDLEKIEKLVFADGLYSKDTKGVEFLLERATIDTYYGFDVKARKDLDRAATITGFEYALTGLMGKRTKFQQKDVSQLVVLAKSATNNPNGTAVEQHNNGESNGSHEQNENKPENLNLNDDTLLESISFTKNSESYAPSIQNEDTIPPSLSALDPSNQPRLEPLDSIILLSLASSITNTSPIDGLTREETLPYAVRVLEGGSSNWQIYTQALLVRSRIEGYRSRTIERGVLQLQALVDQVIADTSSSKDSQPATTFLPRPKPSESALVTERLRYIFQLCSPTRWELEAELAARWVSLGGLRTALEIYERLQMWAEVALCWAAIDREDKATILVRKLLFERTEGTSSDSDSEDINEKWQGPEQNPPPASAPRLFCILGDLTNDTKYYDRAWEVSGNRYARAQRSLGKHYFIVKDYPLAAEAYTKSLQIKRLDHESWFAVGCVYLELSDWDQAVGAFARCVQLDESDAEAWTNLASALLKKGATLPAQEEWGNNVPSINEPVQQTPSQGKSKISALRALKRAAALKRNDYRIWSNLLVVAASASPADYPAVVQAQSRIIEIRGPVEGEACIDTEILERLVRHVITSDQDESDAVRPRLGLERIAVQLVEDQVIPLITSSARLWQLVAKLYVWLRKPDQALSAQEKAWRAVLGTPGWENGSQEQWNGLVNATIELVDAYESFASDGWKFKARSAVRGVIGRGKDSFEGTESWEMLKERLKELKGT